MGESEEFDGPEQQQMPPPMQMQGNPAAFGFAIMGEILLAVGFLFLMLGVGDFLTGLLGIKGSGDVLVGVFLVIAGMLIMSRIRISTTVQRTPPPRPPMMPQAPKPEEKSGSYR